MAINNTSIYEECLKAMARQKIALDVSKYLSLFFYEMEFSLLCAMDFLLAIPLSSTPGDMVLSFCQVKFLFKHFTISKEF